MGKRRWVADLLRVACALALLEALLWGLALAGWLPLPSAVRLTPFDRHASRAVADYEPLYEPDRLTLRRLRAGADITYPRHPTYRDGPQSYRVQINSQGMRDAEVPFEKPPGVIRIACLGDSSTFGFNVEVEAVFPRRLQALLDAVHPGRFQVLNFGVPGDTTLQGVEVLRHRVLRWAPDVVTFAYGTNDRFWPGSPPVSAQLRFIHGWLGTSIFELHRVLNYSAIYRAWRVVLARAGALERTHAAAENPEKLVALEEIESAIAAARQLAGGVGAALLVLNLDLERTDARDALSAGAESARVPFLDLEARLRGFRAESDAGIARERDLALTTLATPTSEFVFRVVVEGAPAAVFVRHVRLMGKEWKTEPLHDDGSHGDERAGDGVWSLSTRYPATNILYYRYSASAAGEPPAEEFADGFVVDGVPLLGPAYRALGLDFGAPLIDRFGSWYLRSDTGHPDEAGHAVIAAELRDAILALPGVRAALAPPAARRPPAT